MEPIDVLLLGAAGVGTVVICAGTIYAYFKATLIDLEKIADATAHLDDKLDRIIDKLDSIAEKIREAARVRDR
jgi:hypothetical protein